MKQKVVIIGHGYTSRLGLIRSLSELDCEITVIAMVFSNAFGRFIRLEGCKPVDCYSKYVHKVYYCNVKDEQGLISILINKCKATDQKVILIPDSDFSASVIDNHQDELKEHFLFPNIKGIPGQVEYWMNKSVQKELARRVGLNVAKGDVLLVEDGNYLVPASVTYPCFTKALATISGGKRFLRRCDNAEMLKKVLDEVGRKYKTKVLIEEYKRIDKEYAVVGFSDGKAVTIPGVIEFITNSLSHFGIAREGRINPINGFEDIVDKFKRFVLEIGFCGLFDIDFYESDSILYFSELNLRFGGSGYAVTKMGVNLPGMLVRYFKGEQYDMSQLIHTSSNYINERMCLDDYVTGYLSWDDYNGIINNVDIRFIHDDNDPGPQRVFNFYSHLQFINRLRRNHRK